MATVTLMPQPRFFAFDSLSAGKPLAGGKIFTYQAGTSTPQATFTDATGLIVNSNPVILDAAGGASIWLTSGQAYRIVAQNSAGVQEWAIDQVSGLATVGSAFNQATTTVAFSATPTFTATGQYQLFKMTLTGNVTSSTLVMTGVTTPSIVSFELTQDATGGRTFTWPVNLTGGLQPNPNANQVTTQTFFWDGSNAWPLTYPVQQVTPVAFSATPTFTATNQAQLFTMTLTGNVTSSTFVGTNIQPGALVTFILTQDGTGNRTFVWPANVLPVPPVMQLAANSVTRQTFLWDGTNLRGFVPGGDNYNPFLAIFKSTTATVHTGTTTNDTIYTIPLPILLASSIIRITFSWKPTVQGAAGTTMLVTLGGSTVSTANYNNTAPGYVGVAIIFTVFVCNRNSVSSQISEQIANFLATANSGQIVTGGTITTAVNTGIPQSIVVAIQSGANSDSQTFNYCMVEVLL